TLSVPEGSTLVFSFIGFEPQSIAVGGRSVIDVVLNENLASLDEVVVVGYGVQRKSDVTGSISVVSGEDLLTRPAFNALEGLKGKASGVNIFTNTGNPLGINESAQRV